MRKLIFAASIAAATLIPSVASAHTRAHSRLRAAKHHQHHPRGRHRSGCRRRRRPRQCRRRQGRQDPRHRDRCGRGRHHRQPGRQAGAANATTPMAITTRTTAGTPPASIKSNARGYYDRDGNWIEGPPNGRYGDDNRWISNGSGQRRGQLALAGRMGPRFGQRLLRPQRPMGQRFGQRLLRRPRPLGRRTILSGQSRPPRRCLRLLRHLGSVARQFGRDGPRSRLLRPRQYLGDRHAQRLLRRAPQLGPASATTVRPAAARTARTAGSRPLRTAITTTTASGSPELASGYYDQRGRWVAGVTTGHYDANGRWVAGQASGHRDSNGRWVADPQPGYYDTNGRWNAGATTGYYDSRGRWVRTDGSYRRPARQILSQLSALDQDRPQRERRSAPLSRRAGDHYPERAESHPRERAQDAARPGGQSLGARPGHAPGPDRSRKHAPAGCHPLEPRQFRQWFAPSPVSIGGGAAMSGRKQDASRIASRRECA